MTPASPSTPAVPTLDVLEHELLTKFADSARPTSVVGLFQGFEPKWAVAALVELDANGCLDTSDVGPPSRRAYRVTPLGREALKQTPVKAHPVAVGGHARGRQGRPGWPGWRRNKDE